MKLRRRDVCNTKKNAVLIGELAYNLWIMGNE